MAIWSVSQGRYVDSPQEGVSSVAEINPNETAAQSLLQMFLSNPTGKNASNLLSGYKELSPSESAEEKKKKMTKSTVEAVLNQIESAYFGGDKVLSYSYPGNKLRGVQETFNAVAMGNNPELSAYLGLRDNLRPTLARAAGDVGNLSGVEQNRAVALIPTATDTPEEAMQKLNTFREKLGMARKDYSKDVTIDKLALPEQQEYYKGKKIFKESATPLDKAVGFTNKYVSPDQEEVTAEEGVIEPTKDRNLWQRIFNTDKSSVSLPLPNLPYGGAGMTAAGFAKTPVTGAVAGGAGELLSNLKKTGIPITKESASEYNDSPFASLLGPLGTILFDKSRTGDVGRSAAKGAGLQMLLHPIKTLTGLRDATAVGKTASTAPIVKGGENFVKNIARPEQIKTGENLLKQDIAKFGAGENSPLKSILEEFSKRGKGAYSPKTGSVLTKSSAAYNQAIQDSLRETIKQASPATGTLTTAIGKLMKIKSALGGAARKYLPWVVGSLGIGYAGSKIGGQ